jgi:hypothetical protein
MKQFADSVDSNYRKFKLDQTAVSVPEGFFTFLLANLKA